MPSTPAPNQYFQEEQEEKLGYEMPPVFFAQYDSRAGLQPNRLDLIVLLPGNIELNEIGTSVVMGGTRLEVVFPWPTFTAQDVQTYLFGGQNPLVIDPRKTALTIACSAQTALQQGKQTIELPFEVESDSSSIGSVIVRKGGWHFLNLSLRRRFGGHQSLGNVRIVG